MSKFSVFACFLVLASVGCARAPVMGIVYSDLQYAQSATSNQTGNRTGESCATSILGLVATGDSSIETARRNGGITLVSSVDESYSTILGIYSKACTIVRGR